MLSHLIVNTSKKLKLFTFSNEIRHVLVFSVGDRLETDKTFVSNIEQPGGGYLLLHANVFRQCVQNLNILRLNAQSGHTVI